MMSPSPHSFRSVLQTSRGSVPPSTRGRLLAASTLLLLLSTGCSSVGTTEIVPEKSAQEAQASALTGQRAGLRTEQLLRLALLDELATEDPGAAIRRLVEQADDKGPWTRVEPLTTAAELALLHGRRLENGDPSTAAGFFLTAAELAQRAALDAVTGRVPALSDHPRFAADLYNFSTGRWITLLYGPLAQQEEVTGPLGTYRIQKTGDARPWDSERFKLTHAAEMAVTGLDNRHRQTGLGASLILSRRQLPERFLPTDGIYPSYWSFYSLSGIVRFAKTSDNLRTVTVELHDPLAASIVDVGSTHHDPVPVPLEADYTAALAAFHEFAAPRAIGTQATFRSAEHLDTIGFLMLEPFREHKIPLILTHGLQSSAVTWIRLANGLRADPTLRDRYQIFAFNYPTGMPFTVSAALLRFHLDQLRERLDPDDKNPHWDQAVIIGHSMGGLVSRLQLTSSGDALWNSIAAKPFEEVEGRPEDLQLLRNTLFFDPVPWISRAVFMATPQRGSRLAGGTLGRMVAGLVEVPEELKLSFERLVQSGAFPGAGAEGEVQRTPSVVESLHPDNPLFDALEALPPQVPFHTVIADLGLADEPTDGIVEGWSASIPGAMSELVLESTHGVHQHPAGIAEVRRILHLHLDESVR